MDEPSTFERIGPVASRAIKSLMDEAVKHRSQDQSQKDAVVNDNEH